MRLWGTVACAIFVLCLSAASTTAKPFAGVARGPLERGLIDSVLLASPGTETRLREIRAIGAKYVRLQLYWRVVAPATRPASFDPANPADPAYRWRDFDREVLTAAGGGFVPIVGIQSVPSWAQRPGPRGGPDPAQLAAFARAAALRYSGATTGLPAVRFWQAWNEPNLSVFLNPQFDGPDAVSPEIYGEMVNAFADAVHAVQPSNIVIAGGLAPYGHPLSPRVSFTGVSPFRFMRELLCLGGRASPQPTCSTELRFDIWSHHPYTAGGPTRQAQNPDDASMGDLPEMRRLLDAGVATGHIKPRGALRFWVTEFSWDSSPPDPNGVPTNLHARWVAEAMYRMWQSGVSLVTWFKVRDDPVGETRYQSGLFLTNGTAKRALSAFRFPFVAFPSRGRVFVWGRTPRAVSSTVVVEQRGANGWTRRASLRANGHGLFTGRVPRVGSGPYRARITAGASLAFSLVRPPDLRLETPFGD